jgi:hypothetical protein
MVKKEITNRIAELGDWRGKTLKKVRALITTAIPDVVEEWKWAKASSPGTPVWSMNGIICTGESYKSVVKLTFAKGASLEDPARLFNASLDGNVRRAIDIHEGEELDATAFITLVRQAAAQNNAVKGIKGKRSSVATRAPRLLSGGNPQIAKGEGNSPVRAYIAGVPGWKRDVARRLDALIVSTVPGVRKAVKWNSPFYGVEGKGWFANFHCFAKYVKVAFFNGASLKPLPPGASKHKDVRYLDIREDDDFDEQQFTKWIKQAARLPGWTP